jgi:hypothetical protein
MTQQIRSLQTEDISPADIIPLRQAIPVVPYQTVYCWSRQGVNGVRLRSFKLGNRLFTTSKWLAEFVATVNSNRDIALGVGWRP